MAKLSKYMVKSPLTNKKTLYKEGETVELDEKTGSILENQGIVISIPDTIKKVKKNEEVIQTNEVLL